MTGSTAAGKSIADAKAMLDQAKAMEKQAKALAKQAKALMKRGVLPTDPNVTEFVKEMEEKAEPIAQQLGISRDKFLDAVVQALGKKTGGSKRAPSRRDMMSRAFVEVGEKPLPKTMSLTDGEKKYIDRFGQDAFNKNIAVLPMPKPVTKKK